MSRPAKTVPMCCVTINYQKFLMPADKGMKVVELMQSAFACEESYGERGYVFQPETEQPSVEYKLVRANQIKAPLKQLLIGHGHE